MLGLATPSYTDLKWSSVMDQFQLCLEQTSPFIHVLWSLGQIAQAYGEPPPLAGRIQWKKMVRFLDRRSREPTLWMVMDCLCARLPPRLILLVLSSQWAAPHSQGHRGLVREGRPQLRVFGSLWWSWTGPNAARCELISSQADRRRTKGSCSLVFRAWRRGEHVLLIKRMLEKEM